MAELLQSNTLLLVNIADADSGPQYKVHIQYSDTEDGSGGMSDTPAAYIGIYIGTEEEPPDDPTLYNWSPYLGEQTYIDIRYSDDGGLTFTTSINDNEESIADGKTVGLYMGVLITTDSAVLDPNYIPNINNNYQWSRISAEDAQLTTYYLEYNFDTILKFYTNNSLYRYTPETITVTAKQRSQKNNNDFITNLSCEIYYEDEDGDIKTFAVPKESATGKLSFSLNDVEFTNYNLVKLVFSIKNEGRVPLITEIKDINFGSTDDMAKLALNADGIVASIVSTKLEFNTDGLTVKNGGIKIENNSGNTVFYVNDKGDLSFSGELLTTSGVLGGWKINEYGLYTERQNDTNESIKVVGLYGGDSLYYPDDSSNSPIRIWAGQYKDENENYMYNFAVTENGAVYANNAYVQGKIMATDGYISNRIFVGREGSGITIYGGEENSSYIGSAQYASGPMGYGWKLSEDGTAEFNNIIARGKIQSSVFEYNKISSIGGSLYVAPTIYIETASSPIEINTLYSDIEGQQHTFNVSWELPYKTLKDLNGYDWGIGDEIKLDGVIFSTNTLELSNLDGIISNIESNDTSTIITITFSSNQDSNLLKDQVFQPGAILILYGSETRRHGLFLTASGENSPYMEIYDNSDNEDIPPPAVRIGNLSGIRDSNFGLEQFTGYGLYSSNAYLRGQLMLPGVGITNQEVISYGEGEAASPIRIWAGIDEIDKDISKAKFIVTANGYMYARQGVFEGTVKASNSEFSGTIKAAGIIIDEGGEGYNPLINQNHFFVAYTNTPSTFNDYVLDIGSHGLSIWEGGLRAYSDYASGDVEPQFYDPVYGYSEENQEPLPFFFLADDGDLKNLNARIVAHKAHFLTIKQDNIKNTYNTNSIIAEDGLYFLQGSYSSKEDIERSIFYNRSKEQEARILLTDKNLSIENSNGNIALRSHTLFINVGAEDIPTNNVLQESVYIKGQVKVTNEPTENAIFLNEYAIHEAVNKSGVSIGIDFIVK